MVLEVIHSNVGFISLCSGKDIQNLIRFLYTGKTSLNEKEFEVFQQLVYEFQISTDENTAIILEEIAKVGSIEQKSPQVLKQNNVLYIL